MLENLITTSECNELRSLIDNSKNIVVCCHVNPDGDAIGSSLGWAEVLKAMGKECRVIVPDRFPDFLQWLPGSQDILRYDTNRDEGDALLAAADLIFCLDFNRASRTDLMETSLAASKAKKVLIDHHLDPEDRFVLTISRPEMSSTCEVVFRLVWQLGLFEQLGERFATAVYCGMMTDTGGFTYNSNDPDIFFAIGQLLTKGIDKDKIYRNVYNNYSEDRLRLLGFVLYHKLVVDNQLHASFFTLSRTDLRRFRFIKGDAEGLVNMPLQIKGMKLSISLREDTERPNLIWVSLRSVDDFPCNLMAEQFFNGGGHFNASGGRLHCTLADAVEVTKRAIAAFRDKLK